MDDNFFWLRFLNPHFDDDNGGTGGGSDNDEGNDDGDDDGDDGDAGDDDNDDDDDAEAAYEALLNKYKGNVERTAKKLQRRNYALRQTNRDLKAQLEQYKKFGKPKEIETVKKERDELHQFKTSTVRKEKVREVAQVAGYDDVVLYDQLPSSVEVFVDLEGEDGKEKAKVAKVKYKDGDSEKTESLKDYATKYMERYLPALEKEPATKEKPKGQFFTRQHSKAGGKETSFSGSYLSSKYKTPKKEA